MDLIFVGAGFYVFYACYLMKKTGEIKKEILMSKEVNLKKCKDIEGYKSFIFPKLLIFGIACMLEGIAGLVNTYVQPIGAIYYVVMVLFFVVLVWYTMQSRKGIETFW